MVAPRRRSPLILEVLYSPEASTDLEDIFDYVAESTGQPGLARNYVLRIKRACSRLSHFPHRGSRRDDLAPGLRMIGFEKRATIVFSIEPPGVVILRILSRGRDLSALSVRRIPGP